MQPQPDNGGRLAGMSRYRAYTYGVIRILWNGVVVPSIMYGMAPLGYTQGEFEGLEKTQNRLRSQGRRAIDLLATEVARGEMGWSSFEDRDFLATKVVRGEMGWRSFDNKATKSKLNNDSRSDLMDDTMWSLEV